MSISRASFRQKASLLLISTGFILLLVSNSAFGAVEDVAVQSIDWFGLAMGLFGGLAMFLFGLEQLSDGLQAASGDALKDVLAKLTKNRFLGAITGAFVTAVLNSSSVTTVLVVSFISAGIMSLSQSVGVIMGANIGSTFTAQIVAFNVTYYALILVAVGFFMLFSAKQERIRHQGGMIMGLGLIFYGMGVMGDAMNPLRTYEPFIELMIMMEQPILGILVGAVFTGLVQSSAATTGIAIVMATEGLISLPAGIALSFGANIGTCVTAMLAAIGKPVEAIRAAVIHVLFNILGVLLWVMFIPQLADFITQISPAYPDLAGKERMAAEVPRQIANAHTVFNVANTLVFIWVTTWFAKIAEKLVPDRPVEEEKAIVKPKFLNESVLEVPSVALENVRFELGHMGDIISDMYDTLWLAFQNRDPELIDEIIKMDDKVDILSEQILEFMSEIQQEELTDENSHDARVLMSATINLESLADVIETELTHICRVTIEQDLQPSKESLELLIELVRTVNTAFNDLLKAIKDEDEKLAAEVLAVKDLVRHQVDEILKNQSQRIGLTTSKHLLTVRLELEFVNHLRRMYTLSKRIARDFVPEEIAIKAE
jgi:phosphate:Na+ symporter